MIDLIVTIFLLLATFIVSLTVHSIGMKCTVKESTRAFRKLIKDIYIGLFKNNETKPILRLGTIDGVFSLEQINLIFKDVIALFEVCFFKNYIEKDLVTIYIFKAKNPLHVVDILCLLDLITTIVEKEVSNLLQLNGIYVNTDSYVATHYKNDILKIAVAKNKDGFSVIEKMKIKAQEEILSFNEEGSSSMTENWKKHE